MKTGLVASIYLHSGRSVRLMLSTISEVIVREPSGRRYAVIMFAGALVYAGLYVYSEVIHDSTAASWLVFMIVGSLLSSIAESLPKNRRREAGILRITAILVVLALLATLVVAPEFIVEDR